MLTKAVLYYLACGDIEATLYGICGGSITIVDLDPKGAELIAWLQEQAVRTVTRQHARTDIACIDTLYF